MIRASEITAAFWQPEIGGDDLATDLADIDQCIRTILTTPLGADPHRPDFGADLPPYVDWPVDRARPHLVREARAAITKWEKRATITRIGVTTVLAGLTLSIEWTAALGARTTQVAL